MSFASKNDGALSFNATPGQGVTAGKSATYIEREIPGTGSWTTATVEDLIPMVKVGYIVYIGDQLITYITSLRITERYGNHNEIEIKLKHDEIQSPGSFSIEGAEKLLGKIAAVTLRNVNEPNGDCLESLFIITEVQLEQEALNEGMLVLHGKSADFLLAGAPHYETFVERSLKDIVGKVYQPYRSLTHAELHCDPAFTSSISFACCFNQNYYDFIKRYAAELGEWFFFDGKQLVYGKLPGYKATKLVYGRNCAKLNMGMNIKSVQGSVEGYDAASHQPLTKNASQDGGNIHYYNEQAYKQSSLLFGTNMSAQPGTLSGDAALQAMAKSRSRGAAADMYNLTGESTNYCLHVGKTAELSFRFKGEEQAYQTIRITAVTHEYEAGGTYKNKFTAISAAAMVPPPVSYNEATTHPVLAEVIDNKDKTNQGRVKVKFMGWDCNREYNKSSWIRVLTPDAGGGGDKVATNRGFVTIPEIGDQVMVDFRNGNPEMPFITGSVFHGKHGTGGGSGNNVKSLTSKSGHTVRLDDGGGMSFIDKSKLNHIHINGDDSITVTAAQNITLTNGQSSITLMKDKIQIHSPNIEIGNGDDKGGATSDATNMTIKGNTTLIEGTTTFDVKAGNFSMDATGTGKLNSKGTMDITSPSSVMTINGQQTNIN